MYAEEEKGALEALRGTRRLFVRKPPALAGLFGHGVKWGKWSTAFPLVMEDFVRRSGEVLWKEGRHYYYSLTSPGSQCI